MAVNVADPTVSARRGVSDSVSLDIATRSLATAS